MPISRKSHPLIYPLAVAGLRLKRQLSWYLGKQKFATEKTAKPLPYKVYAHESTLLRKLEGVDMTLQYNKVTNLALALKKADKILIKPGEVYSFWRLVGKPTTRKGYVEGLMLSDGEVMQGIGGGLCAVANMLHWLALHSPLTVHERHHHSFDAFPDSNRVVPFGTGATLFYNYLDFALKNDTNETFEVRLWLDSKYLNGEIRSKDEPTVTYHVFEKDHAFIKDETTGKYYRKNTICRQTIDKRTGNIINEEELYKNFSETKYTPAQIS